MAEAPELRRLEPVRRRDIVAAAGQPDAAAWTPPLFAMFEVQARREPGRLAIVSETGELSYGELLSDALALAGRLHVAMAGRPRPVIVPARQGRVQITALLACLRLGVAYIPLDLGHSALRNRHIATLSAPCIAVATRAGRELCAGLVPGAPMVVIDDGTAVPAAALPRMPGPAAPGMIVFTSGSSGVPKGVLLSQGELARACRSKMVNFRLGRDDRIAAMCSPTVIGMFLNILAPLLWGACSVVMPEGSSVPTVVETFARHRITHFAAYIGFLRLLVEHEHSGEAFAAIRLLGLHGDRLAWADVARLRRALPQGTLLSYDFGLSECSWVAGWILPPENDIAEGNVALGLAEPELELWLEEPVEQADDGTLTGSFGVTLTRGHVGYWRDPRQDALRLTPHPSDPAKVVLRPGDVISCDPGGLLRFVGRTDNQVKVRGWRVEPEEIEAVAQRAPAVAVAGIVARRDEAGVVQALVLHVAARPDHAIETERLGGFLQKSLPRHMWPTEIVVHGALPMTGTLKIDRARLVELDAQHRDRAAPRRNDGWPDPLCHRIALAIGKEIQRDYLQPGASYGEQGGDSLGALAAALHLEKVFGITVDPSLLLTDDKLGDIVDRFVRQARPAVPAAG